MVISGMGKTLQIRDVPDDIHRALKARAAAADKSLSDYLLTELTRVAERPPIADVLARATARSGGASREDILDTLHAIRDGDE